MLGQYTFIPAKEATMLIQFMQRGRVLAVATTTDEVIDTIVCAELTARILLRQFQQFDSVLIVPFQYGQEPQRRPGKQARHEARRAYKEGLIS